MLKTKIFHFLAETHTGKVDHVKLFLKDMEKHDKETNDFIEKISNEGHTFISLNQVAYGRFESTNRIRTIIVYQENSTRKVITEKNGN